MKSIGIDYCGKELSLALAKKNMNGKIKILCCETIDLSSEKSADVKQLYIYEKALEGKIPYSTGLSGIDLLIKSQSIPLKKKQALKKALPFQQEAQTFLPKNQFLCFSIIEKKDPPRFHLLHYFTTKKAFSKHLDIFKELYLDPDTISSVPHALARFVQLFHPLEIPFYSIYVNNHKTIIVWIENQLPRECFEIGFGLRDLLLNHNEQAVPLEETSWGKEVKKILSSESFSSNPRTPFLFFGQMDLPPYVLDFLHAQFPSLIHFENKYQAHAIPIGLALDELAKDGLSLQLRQADQASLRLLKKRGIKLSIYLAIHLLMILSLSIFGGKISSYHLKTLNKKFALLGRDNIESTSLSSLPLNQMKKAIEERRRQLIHQYQIPYFLPTTPNVSSVLQWLNGALVFSPKEEITIKKVSYEMVQYPTYKNSSIPYVVKIELECHTKSENSLLKAKEFLQKEFLFIDTKKEILCEPIKKNRYRFLFYLQPLSREKVYEQVL